MDPTIRRTTIVSGNLVTRVQEIETDPLDQITVKITAADGREWTFEDHGLKEISYGVYGEQCYVWTDFLLVIVPSDPGDQLRELRCEFPIWIAYGLPGGSWLLVCELSILLWDGESKVTTVDLDDIPVDWTWNPPILQVRDWKGALTTVNVENGELLPY